MSASSLAEPLPLSMTEDAESARWSAATRIAFRFCFAFFLLYNFPFPLDFIPKVAEWWADAWNAVVPSVAQAVFGVAADVLPNGSGDTTWNYVQLFILAVGSVLATLAWSIVDRRALGYPRLHRFLRVYVRFSLAAAMLSYGAAKVIVSQFPPPALARLVQSFGSASPMGMLWTFMGASAAYTIFTGLAETVGGLLLTTRRTAMAGALVTAGVMTHVVVLNFCYDVPVKIYSSFLLSEALFVLAPDVRRLWRFFFASAGPRAAFWKVAVRTIAVLALLAYVLYTSYDLRKNYGDLSPRVAIEGVWNVDELEVDGVVRPPLTTDATRWRRVVFQYARAVSFQDMSDKRTGYLSTFDEAHHRFTLAKRDDPKFAAAFAYVRKDPHTLELTGTMDGHRYHAVTHKAETDEFQLNSRGFHWINEYPFNK